MSRARVERLPVPELGRDVEARVLVPVAPAAAERWLVLAHGAGAGPSHPFLETLAGALASLGFASLRFAFPYLDDGRRRPDRPEVLLATARAALQRAVDRSGGLPVYATGKSMGGRMLSILASREDLSPVRGLVFYGFPLHPARKPATERSAHLGQVPLPMLFLQGTRDALADLSLLEPICEGLGPKARLHVIDDADHGFGMTKRSGRTDEDAIRELAAETLRFAEDTEESGAIGLPGTEGTRG